MQGYRRWWVMVLGALVIVAGSISPAAGRSNAGGPGGRRPAPADPGPGGNIVSLPFISTGGVVVPPVTNAGAVWLPYTTQDNSVVNLTTASMAVDAAGAMHLTTAIPHGLDAGSRPVYYLFCQSGCGDTGSWSRVRLSDWAVEARLRLDAAGHPRVVLHNFCDPNDRSMDCYLYAACDQSCTDVGNWTITKIASGWDYDTTRYDRNDRWFALDQQGHPAFLYRDEANGAHNGAWYTWCSTGDCTVATNWQEVYLNNTNWRNFDLTFAPTGEPRMAFRDISGSGSGQLSYVECDTNCAHWSGVYVSTCGPFCTDSLAVDSQGRPRIVFFTGDAAPELTLMPDQLYYWFCTTTCGVGGNNDWQGVKIGTSQGNGSSQQLVLDGADHPRVAYQMGDEALGYLWCNSNCETQTPGWQAQIIEDRSVLDAEFPNTLALRCSGSAWQTGLRPSLALDTAGNPRVGFDVQHSYYGYDLDKPWLPCNPADNNLLSTDIKLVRAAFLNQP